MPNPRRIMRYSKRRYCREKRAGERKCQLLCVHVMLPCNHALEPNNIRYEYPTGNATTTSTFRRADAVVAVGSISSMKITRGRM